jgi:hypothetical protein
VRLRLPVALLAVARLKGTQRLICELTLRDGKVVYDLNGLTAEDWDKRSPKSTP